MEPFLYYFVFPLLAILTGALLIVSYRGRKIQQMQESHEKVEKTRHEESNELLTRVDGRVATLHQKIDDTVIPKIGELYQAVGNLAPALTGKRIAELLKECGMEHAAVVSENPIQVIFGMVFREIKISFIVLRASGNDLDFYCFSHKIPEDSEKVLRTLMSYNVRMRLGCLYVQTMGNVRVLFNRQTVHLPSGLSAGYLKYIVGTLAQEQYDAVHGLSSIGTKLEEILLPEYIPLHNEVVRVQSKSAVKEMAGAAS